MPSPFSKAGNCQQKNYKSVSSNPSRTWRLVVLDQNGHERETYFYPSLQALARHAGNVASSEEVGLLPLSPNGKVLDLKELQRHADNLFRQSVAWYPAYYFRSGPVEGIRKSRGGYGFFRRPRTSAERRLNTLVLIEDGEVSCRARRKPNQLPNPWDDILRHKERCWKAQHKGRKAWDR